MLCLAALMLGGCQTDRDEPPRLPRASAPSAQPAGSAPPPSTSSPGPAPEAPPASPRTEASGPEPDSGEGSGDVAGAATTPAPPPSTVAEPASAATMRELLPEGIVAFGESELEAGEAPWLAIEGARLVEVPRADPATRRCVAAPDGAIWLWLLPDEPPAALALGEGDAALYRFDRARDCLVAEPIFVELERPDEPLLHVALEGRDALEILAVDLFADVPGAEILSLGELGFRIDAGSGDGAVRTGALGLPIERTLDVAGHSPPTAPWEASLSPSPGRPRVTLEPGDPEMLAALGAAERLEWAWDDALPLVQWPLYEAYPAAPEAGADSDLAPRCAAARSMELTVYLVPGGHLFELEQTRAPGACAQPPTEAVDLVSIESTSLLRLRDGRVLPLRSRSEQRQSQLGRWRSVTRVALTRRQQFWVAGALGSGALPLGVEPPARVRPLEETPRLELERREELVHVTSRRRMRLDEIEVDGAQCHAASGPASDRVSEEHSATHWTLHGSERGPVALDDALETRSAPLELRADVALERPSSRELSEARRTRTVQLFEDDSRQRLEVDARGARIVDAASGRLLFERALEPRCTEGLTQSSRATLAVVLRATPLSQDHVALELDATLEVTFRGWKRTCSRRETLLWHRRRGVVLPPQVHSASREATADRCFDRR